MEVKMNWLEKYTVDGELRWNNHWVPLYWGLPTDEMNERVCDLVTETMRTFRSGVSINRTYPRFWYICQQNFVNFWRKLEVEIPEAANSLVIESVAEYMIAEEFLRGVWLNRFRFPRRATG